MRSKSVDPKFFKEAMSKKDVQLQAKWLKYNYFTNEKVASEVS